MHMADPPKCCARCAPRPAGGWAGRTVGCAAFACRAASAPSRRRADPRIVHPAKTRASPAPHGARRKAACQVCTQGGRRPPIAALRGPCRTTPKGIQRCHHALQAPGLLPGRPPGRRCCAAGGTLAAPPTPPWPRRPRTFRSKNWLSSPYLATALAATLQGPGRRRFCPARGSSGGPHVMPQRPQAFPRGMDVPSSRSKPSPHRLARRAGREATTGLPASTALADRAAAIAAGAFAWFMKQVRRQRRRLGRGGPLGTASRLIELVPAVMLRSKPCLNRPSAHPFAQTACSIIFSIEVAGSRCAHVAALAMWAARQGWRRLASSETLPQRCVVPVGWQTGCRSGSNL